VSIHPARETVNGPLREGDDRYHRIRGLRVTKSRTTSFLTTHVGSLPRPDDLVALVMAIDRGEDVDMDEFARVLEAAVVDRVARQVEAGIDVVSDGEMSKIGYAHLHPPPPERLRDRRGCRAPRRQTSTRTRAFVIDWRPVVRPLGTCGRSAAARFATRTERRSSATLSLWVAPCAINQSRERS